MTRDKRRGTQSNPEAATELDKFLAENATDEPQGEEEAAAEESAEATDGETAAEAPSAEEVHGEESELASAVIVEVALGPPVASQTWGLHIDTKLSPRQSDVLRRIVQQLDQQQAKLGNGRRVIGPNDGIKYLLELVADEAA